MAGSLQPRAARALAVAGVFCFALLATALPAGRAARADDIAPSQESIGDALPEGAALTGRQIYERFLQNRLHSAVQHQTVVSKDPGGNDQYTRFWVQYKDYTSERFARDRGEVGDDVASKTLVKFDDPPDMRHTGYLMITKIDRSSDQFVYRPSDRRVRRVRLEGMTVMGTDYTFDDITYRDMTDAQYKRLPDEAFEDIPCFVIEMQLPERVEAEHYRTVTYLDKQHYVPLRQRFWDRADVEIREMRANTRSMREFDGVWVATESSMYDLQEGTTSTLLIENLDPNPALGEQLFSMFRLELRR
ncbi:MAG: outer membrane lipoprotein-sorting protein [Deltaproteobacteria bacterium]|nr:outer membrane lipoprotein-sorting protein [Deltaproteobacteria bacterium]MBW2415704.1 outer membrane lipoprotein-sorting protein [Deltaproteobacteria bacterium]